ncbi:hypothetical protein VQL36_11535 [Chengkuizengella sp. SCS-71B]|uniref:hypothetical protein n=1 Tax=Chengkuizengella sp. SCS-71B TaxID=3115290 RepID=UPI0032C22DE3
MIEQCGYKGIVNIQVMNKDGSSEEITKITIQNTITDSWLNAVRDAMMNANSDIEIKYIALGDDDSAPSATQTVLGNERFRKAITKQDAGTIGRVDSSSYIAPYEANFHIKEVGFFGGSEATSEKGSGVMVARILYNHEKTDEESINIVRSDILGRA